MSANMFLACLVPIPGRPPTIRVCRSFGAISGVDIEDLADDGRSPGQVLAVLEAAGQRHVREADGHLDGAGDLDPGREREQTGSRVPLRGRASR